jgi:hypothetical protein
MAIARRFAATAVFAGLAVGAASPAWADTPTMNGSYTETATTPTGATFTTSWTVNSCGDGCIYIKAGAGASQLRWPPTKSSPHARHRSATVSNGSSMPFAKRQDADLIWTLLV